MKIKLHRLPVVFLLLYLLTVPATAALEEEEIPYPDRTFLYIVDCSGSMKDYQDVLNAGRQMLSDLLPAENTIVVAFSEKSYVVSDGSLHFGGQTSVLAGIELADNILDELWAVNPAQKVTAILFSDMYSTVEAADGSTWLTEDTFHAESQRLSDIEARWSQYALQGNLKFYSLNWNFESPPDGFPVSFSPFTGGVGNFPPLEIRGEESAQEILKACVEAYSCVLTGSDTFAWAEAKTAQSDHFLTISLEDSYRAFLYLEQAPNSISNSDGTVKFRSWPVPSGGCVLMIENVAGELYTFDGISTDGQALCLTIPQPKIMVDVSADTVICFDTITMSIGGTAGQGYLDYDASNSACLLNIAVPEKDAPLVLSGSYNVDRGCYEFSYRPEKKGSHDITIFYTVYGNEQVRRKILYQLNVDPYRIRLQGDSLRNFQDLRRHLQQIEAGSEFSFNLSDYYTTSLRRLEFIVGEPDDPEIATWEPVSDAAGAVNIRGLQEGCTMLHYTINYYEDGVDIPDNTEEFTLEVSVHLAPKPEPNPAWVVIIAVVAAAIGIVCPILLYRKKNHTS